MHHKHKPGSDYIDGQVCCMVPAGVCLNGSLKDTSLSDFVEQMSVNFFGTVAMTKGDCRRQCHGSPDRKKVKMLGALLIEA